MPGFLALETAKRRTYLENVYRIRFGDNKMEVINFKTVHEINQTVFVIKDGEIKTATITGVLFTDFLYQYKLVDAESNVLFRDEDNVFDTVENAIKDLVLRYTEDWRRNTMPTLQKFNNIFCVIQKLLLSLQ